MQCEVLSISAKITCMRAINILSDIVYNIQVLVDYQCTQASVLFNCQIDLSQIEHNNVNESVCCML